ncbi:MAG: hypothetical protein VKO21_06725 [Candidatus Sericytochromatia bacterium]|nr:hypothetical protein [Candidatus Sericytochromatia bacterium]
MRLAWISLALGLCVQGCVVTTVARPGATASPAPAATGALPPSEVVSVPVLQRLEAIPGDDGPKPARWQLVAEAADRAGTPSYHWSATGGLLSANAGPRTWWTPPEDVGTHLVQVLISSPTGGARTGTLVLVVDATGKASMAPPVFRSVGETSGEEPPGPTHATPLPRLAWRLTQAPGDVVLLVPGPGGEALAWRRSEDGYRQIRTLDGGTNWVEGPTTPSRPEVAGRDDSGWWKRDGEGPLSRSSDGLRWQVSEVPPVTVARTGNFRLIGDLVETLTEAGWQEVRRVPLEDRFVTVGSVRQVLETTGRVVLDRTSGSLVRDADGTWQIAALPVDLGPWGPLLSGNDGTAWALGSQGHIGFLPLTERARP